MRAVVYSTGPPGKSRRLSSGHFSFSNCFYETQANILINSQIALPVAPAHKLRPPGYAWDALKKETVVQLAKQLALFGARGMNTGTGLWTIMSSGWSSQDEAISKMRPALALHG